ncbi:MAG: Ig-like domain repeat protein [Acidobacteriota bacterium]
MKALGGARCDAGRIGDRWTLGMLAAGCLLAGWMATPPLEAQETKAGQSWRPDGRGNRPRTMGPRTAVNNAASTGFSTGNKINYNGGPVLLGTTKVYYIWYGNWDGSSIGILSNLASHIGGTSYFNINTGYFDGNGASVSNSVSFAGSAQDSNSRGTNLSENDIWLIVSNALSQGSLPIDSNGVYFVLTSGNVKVSGFPSTYCGWHSQRTFNNAHIQYAFVGNPDPMGLSGCAQQTVSPNANPGADAMANIIAHELEEAITDPGLDAWYDSSGNENADKCAWTFGSTYTAINGSKANMQLGGKDYLIQQNWVNESGGYCALSASPGPDFALTATVGTQTVAQGDVTGSYQVSVIDVKGFSATITFSVSGLPGGAAFSAIPPSPNGATFTISTNTAGPGTYDLTITGTGGSLTRTASATLVISGQVLTADTLTIGAISPEPSQVGQPYSVSYSVTSANGTPTGNVTVSDGSASCTGTVATGSCTLASTTLGTKTITVSYAGDGHFAPRSGTTSHVVTNGGALAHLTSGAGWETSIAVVNLGPAATSMSLNFFGDSGGPLNLPLTFPQSSAAPANVSAVNQTLESNALLLLDTNPPASEPLSVGWANLTSGGNVNAYEIFHYRPSGQEAVVPMQTAVGASYLLVYDNTGLVNALGTGVAIANGSDQTASVPFTINDDAGAQIGSGSISVAAHGHTAFTLSDQYPATAGKRGTMQFVKPPQGQISVLGIRANGNSFTTIPVTPPGAASSGSMAHIVSGGGWRTVFYVANTAGKTSNVTLSFFDDAGNLLPLPLTFLQTGATLTASIVTRTLAKGAALVIQAQGLDAEAVLGSAQLTSNFGVNAFALFRYDPSGQEATVPFETRNAGAYVLAFDNTAPLATGVAIANLSNQAANVGMTLRDDTGTTLLCWVELIHWLRAGVAPSSSARPAPKSACWGSEPMATRSRRFRF